MNGSPARESEVLEAAADWFVRVRGTTVTADDHAAWLSWIEADPSHRVAFDELQEAWDIAGDVQTPPWPRPQELAAQRPRARRVRSFVALAAGIGAVSLLTIALWMRAGRDAATERIATGRGEQQSAMLADGSRVELGGLTDVAVSYSPDRRLIVAGEGEAFYKVARDAKRPFIVRAGPVSVTALGTAFSVRREGDSVSVVVSEGSVEVEANELSEGRRPGGILARAGERVHFSEGKLVPMPEHIRSDLASTWRRGRLRFEDEPLKVVVANLNRYSQRQIVITDPGLAELRFTGTVFDDRVEDWLTGMQRVFPVKLRSLDATHVAIERAEADAR